jgi:hypothetical protein
LKKKGIGKLGCINFKQGFYAYAGSAKKNLTYRVERHYSREKNWHIDYLLESSEIIESYLSSMDECEIARESSKKRFWIERLQVLQPPFYSRNADDLRGGLRIIGFEKFREQARYHNNREQHSLHVRRIEDLLSALVTPLLLCSPHKPLLPRCELIPDPFPAF